MALPLVLMTHPLPQDWVAPLKGRVRLRVGPAEPPCFAPYLLEQLNEAEGIVSMLIEKGLRKPACRTGRPHTRELRQQGGLRVEQLGSKGYRIMFL
jgi:hypothetical protein